MKENNREREKTKALNGDELDRAVDSALAKYTAEEPRAGLESRILAKLRERPAQAHVWWRWSWEAAVAVVVVAAMLVWRSTQISHPVTAGRPAVEEHAPVKSAPQVASNLPTSNAVPIHRVRVSPTVVRSKKPSILATVTSPKLETFPSTRALSPQEEMLASYVAQFHKQAVLIAEVRNEELRQERAAMFGPEKKEEVDIQDLESGK